ncbi:hypothetical protein GCK32_004381 [Trichostrongylus colubriformis]|uniref:Uncharacterized protein n=1 Tax=Trichostrongylus colubriformis TaxID=6319 RepID=A0AAN8J2C2_TRICO
MLFYVLIAVIALNVFTQEGVMAQKCEDRMLNNICADMTSDQAVQGSSNWRDMMQNTEDQGTEVSTRLIETELEAVPSDQIMKAIRRSVVGAKTREDLEGAVLPQNARRSQSKR